MAFSSLGIAILLTLSFVGRSEAQACPGDCDGDGQVTVNEVVRGVGIGLGNAALDACLAIDTDGDGTVRINEIIAAVNAGLCGCGGCSPRPTPTVTPGEIDEETRAAAVSGLLVAPAVAALADVMRNQVPRASGSGSAISVGSCARGGSLTQVSCAAVSLVEARAQYDLAGCGMRVLGRDVVLDGRFTATRDRITIPCSETALPESFVFLLNGGIDATVTDTSGQTLQMNWTLSLALSERADGSRNLSSGGLGVSGDCGTAQIRLAPDAEFTAAATCPTSGTLDVRVGGITTLVTFVPPSEDPPDGRMDVDVGADESIDATISCAAGGSLGCG